MSIERVVVVLTPLFAALAGLVTSSVSRLVPGVNLNKGDVTAIFIVGATAAASAVLKWLHGRQKLATDVADVDKIADAVVLKVRASGAEPALADIEGVLKTHTDQIIEAVGKAAHVGPSEEQIAEAMAKRLLQSGTATAAAPSGLSTGA